MKYNNCKWSKKQGTFCVNANDIHQDMKTELNIISIMEQVSLETIFKVID